MRYANIKPDKLMALHFEKKKRRGAYSFYIWEYEGVLDRTGDDHERHLAFKFIDRFTGRKLKRIYVESIFDSNKGLTIEDMAKRLIYVLNKDEEDFGALPS